MRRHRFGFAGARGLVLLCVLISAQAANAQEAGKLWISNSIPTEPQLTEAGIRDQIALFFEQYPGDDTPDLMVSGQLAFGERTVYKYDFEAQQPVIGDWSFQESLVSNAPLYDSESALKAGIEQRLNQLSANDGCPAVAAVAISPAWTEEIFWDDGRTTTLEYGEYSGSYSVDTGGQCEVVPTASSLLRERVVDCPDSTFLNWRADLDACGGPPFQITYETAPLPKNECPVGNPCDPTTGDKSEPAPDFDLGWIAFDRHYHSMTSVARSGFGTGWTHSHNLQLAMGVDPAAQTPTPVFQMGLIESDGSQVSFTAVGAAYEASDGSGDRVVADGTQWLLYRSDRVLRFDAAGRVLEQRYEDGTSLAYAYDAMRRLSSIIHSSGRSLVFEYAGTNEAAPIAAIRSAGVALASYTYTATGQVETVTYPGGGQRTYHYEDTRFPQYLTGVTGEDAQRYSTFAYDAKARVVSSVHAGGADGVTLSYPASGGSIVTDALGHATTYGLTTMGASGLPRKPEAFTDSRGSIARTYYDESVDFRRRLKTVTDRNGVSSAFAYAQANDPVTGALASTVTTTQAVGTAQQRVTVRRHDLASNRPIFSSVGDSETRIARNARLQPGTVSVRDTGSNQTRTTTYAYCEAADVASSNSVCPILGLPKSSDGPRSDVNDVIGFEYYGSDDSTCAATPALCTYRKGDLRKTIDALGRATEVLGYDPLGRPLSVLDPNGVITDYEYHPRGWLTATKVRGANNASEADDRITRVEYWPTGLVKKVTLPDGVFTTYAYDAAHRLTDITDSDGNTVHYSLDLAGNRQQEDTKTASGALKRTLSRVFNTLGQLHVAKDAGQNPTTLRYDANGRNDRITDALGRITDRGYDPLGRLSRTLQDVGGFNVETVTAYNALDQVIQVTDPKGLHTVYTYNGFGDRIELTSPDTGVTAYTYNAAGLLVTKQDANDTAAHRYIYDALNRPKAIFHTASGPADIEYDYDTVNAACASGETFAVGRVTAMRAEGTQLQYCYDRFGQIVRKVQSVDSKSFTLRYAYTAAGDLQSLVYPDGAVAQYTRDTQGRIARIDVAPAAGPSAIVLQNAAYQPFGPVNGWQYGNGRSLQRDYDLDYRAKTVFDAASGGLSLGYGYNAANELIELKDGLQSASLAKYDYDPLGRLKITRDGPTGTPLETYGYDATGNRASLLRGGITDTYSYPGTSHRLSGVGAVARSYDAVGNTIAIGGTAKEYVYNANDRMKQVKQGGVVTMGYRYNAKGERVAATSGDTGPVTTYTLYDEAGHWIGDYDSAGASVQQAIWFDDAPVGLLAGAGAAQSLKYVQPDHLGTPRAVIDPSRNVAIWAWDAKSEAFGNSPPNQDPDLDGVAFVFDMRFPGQRYDAATGLSYNYFRDYDPIVGRYVQSDPIGLEGGTNSYAYANGNPLKIVDPLGLSGVVASSMLYARPTPVPFNAIPRPIPQQYRFLQPRAGETAAQYQRRISDHRINEARNWKNESPYVPGSRSSGRKVEDTGFGLLGRLLKNLKDIADDFAGFAGFGACPVESPPPPMTSSELADCISQGLCA